MTLRSLLLAVSLVVSAETALAHGDEHAHTPLHGGVVAEVKDMDYELVAKPGVVQRWLRDRALHAALISR
ncbi:MAG: hypothetical protein WA159_08185 [Variovorax sp.]